MVKAVIYYVAKTTYCNIMGRYRDDEKSAPDKILGEITIAGKNGIWQKDLLYNIRPSVDRTTVFRITKKYEKDGKIKIITKGRRTKYVLVEKALALSDKSAYILGRDFAFRFLHENNVILCEERDIWPDGIDVTSYKQFFEPKFDPENLFTGNTQLEKTLFEFSNLIGAFIAYVLIQAMNPGNRRLIGNLKDKNENTSKKLLGSLESKTDQHAKKWTRDAITTVIPYLLWDFRTSIHKRLGSYPKNFDEKVKYFWKPDLVFDRETARKAKSALARLYPFLNYELDDILRSLPAK
jgi:hypothetical protein